MLRRYALCYARARALLIVRHVELMFTYYHYANNITSRAIAAATAADAYHFCLREVRSARMRDAAPCR